MKSSNRLIVVSDLRDLPEDVGPIVTADAYLAGESKATRGKVTVINLCRSWRYLSKGYYVSLLADARGQDVLPSIGTIEGMATPHSLFRALQEAGIETVDLSQMSGRRRALPDVIAPTDETGLPTKKKRDVIPLVRQTVRGNLTYRPAKDAEIAEVLVYLGQCRDKRFQRASATLFKAWPAPILRVRFLQEDEEWKVIQVSPLMLNRLTKRDRNVLVSTLREKPSIKVPAVRPHEDNLASIAVLFDENDAQKPSTSETIDRLERVAAKRDVHIHRIGPTELSRLGDYDALFIRSLTGLDLASFRFAQRAEALGMPVVDDTHSIICCTNKVYLHELLTREGVPTPRTLVATRLTRYEELERELKVPFIVKLPDGSFSMAVHKVDSADTYRKRSAEMFRSSPLIIAQANTPTAFDWRVTTLDGKALFVCKYHMAPGHWQIRDSSGRGVRYGKVEAVPRELAPREVLRTASRASRLIGDGLYGVDLKETEQGVVVIEVNDNPNIDIGYDDAADGDVIYDEILSYFIKRIEQSVKPKPVKPPVVSKRKVDPALAALRKPIGRMPRAPGRPFQAFEVCGIELEYPIVDRDLNAKSLVEPAFTQFAGHATSDIDLGVVGFSNEIYDHVFEVKTSVPLKSLAESEEVLVEGIQRFSLLLADRFNARLMPTGMHPWFDPAHGKLWKRSNTAIYDTYARLFNVKTHGWANVQACHVNLPVGRREHDAVAMMNAAALLVPYLPALAASSPVYDGELQPAVDNRLAFILTHQSRVPESTGDMVPEFIDSLAHYRKDVLGSIYKAVDRLPNAKMLRHEFFNARGAVFKFSRDSMEIRVLDMQECVKMDLAIACFVRSALKALAGLLRTGKLALPQHSLLVQDLHSCVNRGTSARVHAPYLCKGQDRDEAGCVDVRSALQELLKLAETKVRPDEEHYLELIAGIIEHGNLSERMAAVLRPYLDDDVAFTDAARRLYIELSQCLLDNEPWPGRGI